MVLFDTDISPFEQVNVALDLETTGLDSNRHQILEIGAVRQPELTVVVAHLHLR